MHKLEVDSLIVSSFEAAPAVELMDPTDPETYPRCTANLTGCMFCQPPLTQ